MKNALMVVDDDPGILAVVEMTFKNAGFEVITASSGHECIKKLEQGFKGVILLDIMMPDMDGWGTIKEIVDRGLMEGIVISMLTAMHEPDIRMDDLKEYVLDYITKPFEPRDIVERVKETLSYLEQ